MNKKWLKKYVLPAILAVTVPIAANAAEIFNVGAITWENPTLPGETLVQIAGVNLNEHVWTKVYFHDYIAGSPPTFSTTKTVDVPTITGIGHTYNVGKVDISTNLPSAYTLGVQASSDYEGIYNLSDITITKTGTATGTTVGFEFSDADSDTFSGKVLGKANITIDSAVGDVIYDTLYGVRFAETDVKQDPSPGAQPGDMVADPNNVFAGTAEFGTITIKNGKVGALGIDVGDVAEGASITADKIDVSSTANAVGLSLQAPNVVVGDQGTIKIGEIKVSSDQFAAGVTTDPNFATYKDSAVNIELGKVDAVAKDGDAYGIKGANLMNITLTDDVTATSETANGYGISAEDAWFTVAEGKTVNITGSTAGIKTTGTGSNYQGAAADLGANSILNVDTVDVGDGDIDIYGEGTANFNALYQTSTTATDGWIMVGGGATLNVNWDNVTGDSTGAIDVEEGSHLRATSTSNDQDIIDGYIDAISDRVTDFGTGEMGLVDFQSDLMSAAFGADGSVTLLGPGLSNGFVAAANIHQRYSAWNAVRDHMISATGNRRGILGQECDPCDAVVECDPCDPCGTFGNGIGTSLARSAWVNYVGRGEEYTASLGRKWKLGMDGVQVGTDLYKTSRNQFGVIFGYEGGNLSNKNNLDNIKADDIYAGVYGAHVFRNGVDLRGSFAYGWQDYKMTRQAFDNSLYNSKFDGKTSETTIELGKRFFNGNWSMRPVFGVDVMTNELDKAQEVAVGLQTASMYSYGKTDLTQVFLRTGTDLRWQLRRLTFNSGIYYSYDINGDDLVAYANDGVNAPIKMVGSDMGRELLTFNVGGEYQFNNFSVFGGYQGQAVLDTASNAYQSIGYVGGAWKW